MGNAKLISDLLTEKGIWFSGGVCSPYIWLKCPNGMDSWTFFDWLLENAQVGGTPGLVLELKERDISGLRHLAAGRTRKKPLKDSKKFFKIL